MDIMIFKSKDIDNIYVPTMSILKNTLPSWPRNPWQELLKKSTVNDDQLYSNHHHQQNKIDD